MGHINENVYSYNETPERGRFDSGASEQGRFDSGASEQGRFDSGASGQNRGGDGTSGQGHNGDGTTGQGNYGSEGGKPDDRYSNPTGEDHLVWVTPPVLLSETETQNGQAPFHPLGAAGGI